MDFGTLANGMFLGGNAFEAGRQQAKPRYYTRANWSGNGLANTGLQEIDMNKGLANPWDMMNHAYGSQESNSDWGIPSFSGRLGNIFGNRGTITGFTPNGYGYLGELPKLDNQ